MPLAEQLAILSPANKEGVATPSQTHPREGKAGFVIRLVLDIVRKKKVSRIDGSNSIRDDWQDVDVSWVSGNLQGRNHSLLVFPLCHIRQAKDIIGVNPTDKTEYPIEFSAAGQQPPILQVPACFLFGAHTSLFAMPGVIATCPFTPPLLTHRSIKTGVTPSLANYIIGLEID
ncbi:hypothetical protein RRG08_050012 [Elysia crispata]|uniref:Uncharacterized protein n=1 Tax=Elysia crispata TaxID=231223 RepID=A0AAE1EDM0_9GAST|nr:hypothetical protein RRG08_050012 [Elysia crispata]